MSDLTVDTEERQDEKKPWSKPVVTNVMSVSDVKNGQNVFQPKEGGVFYRPS